MSPRGSTERLASHGRGGAGNIAKDDPGAQIHQSDLVTPSLKSDIYTTGRGGTGNMARNDPNHPELARAAQDVDSPGHREDDAPRFFGRGGAANYGKPSGGEQQFDSLKTEEVKDKGLVEKLKEKLSGSKN